MFKETNHPSTNIPLFLLQKSEQKLCWKKLNIFEFQLKPIQGIKFYVLRIKKKLISGRIMLLSRKNQNFPNACFSESLKQFFGETDKQINYENHQKKI